MACLWFTTSVLVSWGRFIWEETFVSSSCFKFLVVHYLVKFDFVHLFFNLSLSAWMSSNHFSKIGIASSFWVPDEEIFVFHQYKVTNPTSWFSSPLYLSSHIYSSRPSFLCYLFIFIFVSLLVFSGCCVRLVSEFSFGLWIFNTWLIFIILFSWTVLSSVYYFINWLIISLT